MENLDNGWLSQRTKLAQKIWPGIVFLLLVIGLGVRLYPFAKLHDAIFIVSLCIILFAFSTTFALTFVLRNAETQNGSKRLFSGRYKYELGLIVVIIITTLPLLFKPYFYYDDWLFVGNKNFPCKITLFIFGRPIQTLFFSLIDNIVITNAYIVKWLLLFAIILYSLVLYRWLLHLIQNEKLAFLLAGILSIFAPVMDLLGYSSPGAITYSFLFSTLSVIAYHQAYEASQQRAIRRVITRAVASILLLLTACLTYQLGPQIIFLFLVIELFFSVKPTLTIRKHFIYLVIFAFTYGFYLLLINGLTKLNNLAMTTNRAQIINSIDQVEAKIQFYTHVLEQSVMQVGTALSGNVFLVERYHGYNISYSNVPAGNLLYFFIIIVILFAFVGYLIKTKSILGLLALVIYVPMSYFSFLILADSAYLTYYAFAHISILMFFFIMGLITLVSVSLDLAQKIRPFKTALHARSHLYLIYIPVLLLCAWVSNSYVRDFYINFNSHLYNFIKDSIKPALESNELKRIHIVGTISPLNADVYSLAVVQTALKEYGENIDEFSITYSKSPFYLARIENGYYLDLLQDLSEDDTRILESFYTFDSSYSQYNINRIPSEEEELLLYDIFLRSGAIPQQSSSTTLLIDLTWTDQAYYNNH